MEIKVNRISATPRSKYKKYYYGSSNGTVINSGDGSDVDLSNCVWLSGRETQTIQGNVGATGDVVAYQTTEHDITLPIASNDALGAIKVGSGLTITEDGTLTVTGTTSGGTGTVSEWGDIKGTLSNQTDLWNELTKKANLADLHIQIWDEASQYVNDNKAKIDSAITNTHKHNNKQFLDVINQNLSTTSDVNFQSVKATGDIIAYSTGQHDITFPIASSTALGCIMVGSGLTITEDGVLSVSGSTGGGTVSEWGDITGTLSNQTDLWNELQKKALKTELHTHSNMSVLNGIDSTDINNWNTAYNQRHTHNNLSVLSGISSTNITNWNTAYSQRHTHSNKSVLDGISSSDVSSWDSAYNNSHTHSNKSYLDSINQSLSTSSSPNFRNLTTDLNIVAEEDIYANNKMYTQTLQAYTSVITKDVTASGNVKAQGDVIAYSTGTASAPFKYWRPSVNSSGVISWTNSTSETVPSSVNIKGPAGTNGKNGTDGASLTYQWSGTSLRIGTTKNGSTTWGSYVNLKGADGSSFNGGTITNNLTVSRSGGVAILGLYGYHTTWQAAQIQLVNNGFSDYRHKWTIDLAGSSEQNGDLCFQNYNSQDKGSPNSQPWYRMKIFKHGTATNAIAAAGAYVNNSDERLKNVLYSYHNKPQTISEDGTQNSNSVLERIKNLESKYFYWKVPENADEEEKQLDWYNTIQLGFIAQEVEEVFPEFVSEDNGYKQLNYSGLGSFLAVEASRELNQKIEQQQTEIQLLNDKIIQLETLINEKINPMVS